ncbi:MAG: hypothetical protein HYY18_11715 [Planctomycetes bacterium]|nr:hypothetical protein [Planctomycetota bacterium]
MRGVEISEEEAVEKLLRVIASKHARKAAASPPDMNDPDAVLRWLEAAARAAEEEFDRLMGVMPPATETRRRHVQELMEA